MQEQKRPLAINYDEEKDIVSINGLLFTGDFFRFMIAPKSGYLYSMRHTDEGCIGFTEYGREDLEKVIEYLTNY